MSVLEANGIPVFAARITDPERGAWFGGLELAAESIDDGAEVVLRSYDGALELTGTVLRGKLVADRFLAQVVGGHGALEETVTPMGYRSTTAQIVAASICGEVGEVLAPSEHLGVVLASWTRRGGKAKSALDELSRKLGVPWRIDGQGRVLFAPIAYDDADDETAVELDRNDDRGELLLGVETPRLRAGHTIRGVRARTVVHYLDATRVETKVLFGAVDRVRGAVDRLVDRATTRIDLLARYEARVVRQSAVDDSLEVIPTDTRIPPLSDVPLRVPFPGARVLVTAGSKVLIGWDGGDATKPYAESFDRTAGGATRVDLKAPDVRLGDVGTAQPLAIAALVSANFATLVAAINTIAPGTIPGPLPSVATTATKGS